MPSSQKINLILAAKMLSKQDSNLAPIIKQAGLADIEPHTDYYGTLVNSIIGQQLSVKAAATIKHRFQDLFGGKLPEPELILQKTVDELRTAGLSGAKANYVRDLAKHVVDGNIDFTKLNMLSNVEIVGELTAVKGIGEWTAHMFLIFCMGRLDVLPTGDLGIRNGVQKLYQLENLPSPQKVSQIAADNNWHPYESVASWYIWHSLDNKPN